MKILVTGSGGRVGRAIRERLRGGGHQVLGYDLRGGADTDIVADIRDRAALDAALAGAEAVVHVAALHAPHVGIRSDADFEAINVEATELLARLVREHGIRRLVFTSTTALYGAGAAQPPAAWVDEDTVPRPRTIYHHTKIAAERLLEEAAVRDGVALTILRMSRCFPEPAPWMAAYRLHRGIDARDVAEAHALALAHGAPGVRRFIVSGETPFRRADAAALMEDAPSVLRRRAPDLVAAFAANGWPLPAAIDRVYDSSRALRELGWKPRHGFREVLAQLAAGSPEVLPP